MMRRTPNRHFVNEILRAGVFGMALVLVLTGGSQNVLAVSQELNHMVLVATPKGRIAIQKSGHKEPSLPTLIKPSVNPTANILRARSGSTSPLDALQTSNNPILAEECLVDFSDYDALDLLEFSLHPYAETTFAYTPWWHQACNGLMYVEVRPIWTPLSVSHFHLGYENPHITTCPGSFTDWGIIQDDGTCQEIEPRDEPRSLHPHEGHRPTHIFVTDGGINDKKLFKLNRIRVESTQGIQLCYKPMQEIDGPWISSGVAGSTHPGIWYCWDELPTGNWDLSDWTDHITEVKIRASHGSFGIYQIDDIGIGIY
ncbi:MAG TPA: hypothetical protein PKM72_15095 [Nitrospirales bacterium]|nr:hypothetical protein [Nitrospirales bacterium]